MKVKNLYIIGISKGGVEKEVVDGIAALSKKYSKGSRPGGASTIYQAHFPINKFDLSGKTNRRGAKAKASIDSDAIFLPPADRTQTAGAYFVFHGGTDDPISPAAAANITLKLVSLYNPKMLRKVVMLGCYYGSTFVSGGAPFSKFCTTLVLEAKPTSIRENLPMVAAWDADIYIKGSGRKQTKYRTEGNYTSIDPALRKSYKIIAAVEGYGPLADYKLKTYEDAGSAWHD